MPAVGGIKYFFRTKFLTGEKPVNRFFRTRKIKVLATESK
jgi:hypothetical protein